MNSNTTEPMCLIISHLCVCGLLEPILSVLFLVPVD